MSQEERLMILQMVADKKITATEAAELLRALEGKGAADEAPRAPDAPQSFETPRSSEAAPEAAGTPRGPQSHCRPEMPHRHFHPAPPPMNGLGSFIEGLVDRVSGIFSEMVEPRYEFPSEFTGEFPGSEVPLRIVTGNGRVTVRAWDQPGYKATVVVKAHGASEAEARARAQEAFTVKTDGAGFELETRRRDWGWDWNGMLIHVTLDVPREKTYRLEGRTGNGQVELENLIMAEGKVNTGNGKVVVRGGSADRLSLRTGNGSIEMEADAADLEAESGNGSVTLVPLGSRTQTLRCSTGNGSVSVDTGRILNAGFRVEAHTGMGGVALGIPNMVHEKDVRTVANKHVIAKTDGYEHAAAQVFIVARTGMGSINIE